MSGFFINLLNRSITAGFIIIAVILVRFLLKKAPRVFSYALWGIVLLRLLCPVGLSSPFSVFNLFPMEMDAAGEMQYFSGSQETGNITGTSADLSASIPLVQGLPERFQGEREEIIGQHMPGGQYPVQPSVDVSQDTAEKAEENVSENVADTQQKGFLTSSSFGRVVDVLSIIWLAGAMGMLLINMVFLFRLKRSVAVSLQLQGNVYLSDGIDTPFCLGFFPAKIYLPSDLGEQEREYILMHERCHIRRMDHVIKLLAFLALCLHWFNPLVWIAFVLAGRDMEMSCDEAVMRELGTDIRAAYSASLLRLATGRRFAPSPLSFGEGNPKDRIRNIMNYKKPAFWLLLLAAAVCVVMAISLGTNPMGMETGNHQGESGQTESEGTVSENQGNGAQEDSVPVNPARQDIREAYYSLIALARTAIYDPQSNGDHYDAYLDEEGNSLFSSEVTKLYDGKLDQAYQNIGYLIRDINGDGVEELLFGERDVHPGGEWDGIIYDLYTFVDNRPVHVFQGWNRKRYFLTEEGKFMMEGSSSASEMVCEFYDYNGRELVFIEKIDSIVTPSGEQVHTYTQVEGSSDKAGEGSWEISEKERKQIMDGYPVLHPEFLPLGPIWISAGDIGGDGRMDYVIRSSSREDDYYDTIAVYIAGEGIVFTHQNGLPVGLGSIERVDLNHDGEDEILLTLEPHVNSMPLMEYAVLKKTGDSWEMLEMYHTKESMAQNSFPISIYHGKEPFEAEVTCKGLEKTIYLDLTPCYQYWKATGRENETAYYENEIRKAGVGKVIGGTSAWGIWEISQSAFGGQPCLVAVQGIEGYSRDDSWGTVKIFFDYDSKGKIRVLDLQLEDADWLIPVEPALQACESYAEFFVTPDGKITGLDGFSAEELVFSLEYIDEDDIPELLIGSTRGMHGACAYILSYKDGELTVSGPVGAYNGVSFLEGTGILFEESFSMGAEQLFYYRLKKGNSTTLLCSRERQYNEQDILIKTTCLTEGKTVSESDFLTYALKLEQGKTRRFWNSYDNAKGYYPLSVENLELLRNGKLAVGSAEAVQSTLAVETILTDQGEMEDIL